jgi:hypothetical protein
MHIRTLLDTTRFEAVMATNLSELCNYAGVVLGWVTSWEVWFG